jgi:hypothetical protein
MLQQHRLARQNEEPWHKVSLAVEPHVVGRASVKSTGVGGTPGASTGVALGTTDSGTTWTTQMLPIVPREEP